MKKIVAFLIVLFVVSLLIGHAQQNADGIYLNLYTAIQQADDLASSGDLGKALAKYTETQAQLQQFKNSYPDWNPKIVTFRLKYVTEKIDDLTLKLTPPASAANVSKSPALPNSTTDATTLISNGTEAELAALHGQLAIAQSENATLLAKLKEALRVQPAAADAGELAKLQEQVRALMKENDLLKAGAAQGGIPAVSDKNASAQALATMNSTENEKIVTDLKQAWQQITNLESDVQLKQLENIALENRLHQLQSVTNTIAIPLSQYQVDKEVRVRELTQERDTLLAKLGEANKQLYGSKKQDMAAQMDQLTDQVRTLRDRLAVAEAQPVPYTPEELALLKQTAPQPVTGVVQKKSVKQLPAGSAALVSEAQNYFVAGQFDRAEANYLKVLQQDENNALVLGNLAAIEMQEDKLADAEKHIQAAIAQDPNDVFFLSTIGNLKFKQEKYDEALDFLSRAAKLNPQNPQIQNYLGVTLSSKGMRPQAEAALRKAVELDPNYADAQNNLAAIYISATPPRVELARWHYQKALQAGHPHNLGLEKALSEKGLPPSTP